MAAAEAMDSQTRMGLWPVRLAISSLGAAALGIQVIMIRAALFAFGGNELVMGLFLTFWLAAIGTGALAGGFAVKRSTSPGMACLSSAVFLCLLLTFFWFHPLIGMLRHHAQLPAGGIPRFQQIIEALAWFSMPLSFLIGFLFPLLTALRRGQSRGAGEVYALEAAGSLGAGFLATYCLLPAGRDDLLVLLINGLLLIGAWSCLQAGRRLRICAWLCLFALGVWLVTGHAHIEATRKLINQKRWQTFQQDFSLSATRETAYGNLTLLHDETGIRQLYRDGQYAFTFPDLVAEEMDAHIAATQAIRLNTVVIFGGPPGLVREFSKYRPKAIHRVCRDGRLSDWLQRYGTKETQAALKQPHVQLPIADPRIFIKQRPAESCDLIFSALSEPASAGLNRFYTVDCFREIHRALSPEGVFTFTVDAGPHLTAHTAVYAAHFLKTLKAVFPEAAVSAGLPLRFFAAKKPGVISMDPEVLAKRFAGRGISASFFQPIFFKATEAFQPEALEKTRKRLARAAQGLSPERDSRPTLFIRKLILEGLETGATPAAVLDKILGLPAWMLLPPALLPGLIIFRIRKRQAAPLVITMGTTGFWGMAMALLLIFLCQLTLGGIYSKIGMLTGAFMGGLSLGALRGRKIKKHRPSFLLLECVAVGIALLTPVVAMGLQALPLWGTEIILMLWSGVAGAVTGAEFGLINRILVMRHKAAAAGVAKDADHPDASKSSVFAALTDGADHLGACAGALLTGLLLLPVLGLAGTAGFLVLLKTATLAAVGLRIRG